MALISFENALKVSAPIIGVLGLLFGVIQFNRGETDRVVFEQNSKIWLNELETCKQVADLTGAILISSGDDKNNNKAIKAFRQVFWGTMILVEDKAVTSAMIAFDVALADYQGGFSSRLDSTPDQQIRLAGKQVIDACRAVIHRPPIVASGWW